MVELEWEAKRSSARFAERAQQMAGSFNRLLAKAPKRRLTRRGGAWEEGDLPFAKFRKTKISTKLALMAINHCVRVHPFKQQHQTTCQSAAYVPGMQEAPFKRNWNAPNELWPFLA